MLCPSCGADMQVRDTRVRDDGVVRRRRVCACGRRLITFESTVDPAVALKQRAAANARSKAYLERQDPETLRLRHQMKRLRRMARDEAQATGEAYEAVCARWNIEPDPSRTRAKSATSRSVTQPQGAVR